MPSMVRLPQSAHRRGVLDAARLLRRIDPRRPGFFRLCGILLLPGSLIPEERLWPGPDWPATPLLLEMTSSRQSRAGHHGSLLDLRLWQYSGRNNWRELARSEGRDQSGYLELMPVIERALEQSRFGLEPRDIAPAIRNVVGALDHELEDLVEEADRERLLSAVYLELAMRACRENLQLAS